MPVTAYLTFLPLRRRTYYLQRRALVRVLFNFQYFFTDQLPDLVSYCTRENIPFTLFESWQSILAVFLVTHLAAAFVEFFFHRYVLHAPLLPFLSRFYKQHTLHHALTRVGYQKAKNGQQVPVLIDTVAVNVYPIEKEPQYESYPYVSILKAPRACPSEHHSANCRMNPDISPRAGSGHQSVSPHTTGEMSTTHQLDSQQREPVHIMSQALAVCFSPCWLSPLKSYLSQRQREKNRAAQQAFRIRQKIKVEALESEWTRLRQVYEALGHAWTQRAEEIKILRMRVEELIMQIDCIKLSQEHWASECYRAGDFGTFEFDFRDFGMEVLSESLSSHSTWACSHVC